MFAKTSLKVACSAALVACAAAAEARSQAVLIAGPGGQLAEMRHDGGFRLRLPGRPPVYGGGVLDADGPRREFWLVDYYFGLMVHAEAVLGAEGELTGDGRIQVYGPWPVGHVAFSGPAWEQPVPDEEEEEGCGPPPAEVGQ